MSLGEGLILLGAYFAIKTIQEYGRMAQFQRRDNSDPPDEKLYSGVSVCTDHLTGVQYLKTKEGGLTPRLDKDGRILGEGR